MPSVDRYRTLLFIGICIFVVSAAEVVTILTSVSPANIPYLQLIVLFSCLWVVCTGVFLVPWSFIKKFLWPARSPKVLVSLRQAGLMSLLPVGSLFLSSLQLLRVWEAVPLALSLFLLELFFEAETPIR